MPVQTMVPTPGRVTRFARTKLPRLWLTDQSIHFHESLTQLDDSEPRILAFPSGEVKCRQRLGGPLKLYYRAAA